MSDIFLSYNREDKRRAEDVARALEGEGFSVWWDIVLRAGETYDEVTEDNLREAHAVVVLWSERSVKSKWVRAEATLGQRKSALIPAMIEECERPLLFELMQTADLTQWDGDRDDEEWRNFVEVIRSKVEESAAERAAAPAAPAAAGGATSDEVTIETTFWNSIKDGGAKDDFEAYLERYPSGYFATLARNRLKALGAPAPAPAAKPAPKPVSKPAPKPAPAAKSKPASKPAPKPAPKKRAKAAAPKKVGGGGRLLALIALVGAVAGGYAVFGTDLFKSGGASGPEAAAGADPSVAPEPPRPPSARASVNTFVDCEDCPTMVTVPAGTFMMGSPSAEIGRYAYEGPQREVRVAAFAISRYEVTFDEWQACVDAGSCGGYEPRDEGWGKGTRPVINISWNDAQQYVGWLSTKTGRRYRLPTEAEWEYAARGGTTTRYWWGDTFDDARVARRTTQPVGGFAANPFGLHDMLSNAREWVEDCYARSYDGLANDARAFTGGDCSQRTVRGGSYRSQARDVRVANRARFRRTIRDDYLGIRLVTDAR